MNDFVTLCAIQSEGAAARQAGKARSENPYYSPDRYDAWDRGWVNGAA